MEFVNRVQLNELSSLTNYLPALAVFFRPTATTLKKRVENKSTWPLQIYIISLTTASLANNMTEVTKAG
jgi:hypothetical protein